MIRCTHFVARSAALAAVTMMLGCGGGAGASPAEAAVGPGRQGGPAVELGFHGELPAGPYTSVESFELASTARVVVVADWRDATRDQAERLDIFSPTGHLFYSTTIPFEGAAGSDRLVTVQPYGWLRASYLLEIAGTVIEAYQMTGSWRITVTLVAVDGSSAEATGTFALR